MFSCQWTKHTENDLIMSYHIPVATSATMTQNGHHYLKPLVVRNELLKIRRFPICAREEIMRG